MVLYIVSEPRHNYSVKQLGLIVRMWVICRCGDVLDSEVATNKSAELAYKLWTVVRNEVS